MSRLLSTTALVTLLGATVAFGATDLGHSTNGIAPGASGAQVADSRGWYYDSNGVFHILTIYGTGLSPIKTPPPANDNNRPRPTLVNSGDRHGPFL